MGSRRWSRRPLPATSGRDDTDLDVQVIATVLVGALVAATRHWHESAYAAPLGDEMERALAVVENGLKLSHGQRNPNTARDA